MQLRDHTDPARETVTAFIHWLDEYGDFSQDHYDFWATRIGRRAKAIYYRKPRLGFPLVVPFVVLDTIVPASRRLFRSPQRFPIADAHYAIAFFALARLTGDARYLAKANSYIAALEETRCPGQSAHCWGYPFDWETCFGTFTAGTPLITTIPYVFEAFEAALDIGGVSAHRNVLESIASFVHLGFRQTEVRRGTSTTSYTPSDPRRVVNANAYRAFLLTAAAHRFGREDWHSAAESNLRFVLENQHADGSWLYAIDGRDAFIDNFHTCFVLKNLLKIWRRAERSDVLSSIKRGYAFYKTNLLDDTGAPRPFAKTQRITMPYRELYDYAEGINLAVLLEDVDPDAGLVLERLLRFLFRHWRASDGHFVTRRYPLLRNRVPYHRWAQSQTFHALVMYLVSRPAHAESGSVVPVRSCELGHHA